MSYPDLQDLILAARDLAPTLAAQALATEQRRSIAPDTIDALRARRLFRLLQPARVGGLELSLDALVCVCAELARGCASTAWVVGNLASHQWMLGMWPARAQDDVWGVDGDALVAASLSFPAGRAVPCDGGYRLSGRWSFASGIDACDWVMLGAIVSENEEEGEYRLFLLPAGECSVEDNWFAAGLAGTGSKCVIVQAREIPTHRTLALDETRGGATPGSAVNPGPLYHVPLLPTFGYMVAGVPLGIAEGLLDTFAAESRSRLAAFSGRALSDFQPVQARLAEASALSETSRTLLLANCEAIFHAATQPEAPTLEAKARWRRDAAFAARLAVRAVDLLFEAGGGGALLLTHPSQRAFRDAHASVAHIALNWDAAAAVYGLVALGHDAELPPYER